MDNEMDNYYVINGTSGEITQDLGKNPDGTYFIGLHEGESVYRPTTNGFYDYEKLKYDYVKFNYKASFEIYHKCPQLLLLIPFISYKDNILKFANGHFATMSGLARNLGFNEDYFRGKLMKKLKDLDVARVIKHNGKRAIVINPYVVYKGKEVSTTIKRLFENSDWAILANGGANGRENK